MAKTLGQVFGVAPENKQCVLFCMIPEDDDPTLPGTGDPGLRFVTQVYADVCPLDRKKLIRLVEDWYGMSLTQRILLESVAGEFVRPTGGV